MLSFTGNILERASDQRSNPAWLAKQRQIGLVLPFWQSKPLLTGDPPRAQFLPSTEIPENVFCAFLGLDGKIPLFAADLGAGDTPPLGTIATFHEMRAAAAMLPDRDTAIAGQAKAMLDWNARNRFCANCGNATESGDGGYRRTCPQCKAQHFPRTDPVVIMLPLFGERCLVGRNKRFQNNRYSAFAGFIEPGETMEEAVRRELREEVRVEVGAVRYYASQPWPFPSSLMLGCYADAVSEDFTVDNGEIGDACWITRDEALRLFKRQHEDDMSLPDTIAIAHHLIKEWAEAE